MLTFEFLKQKTENNPYDYDIYIIKANDCVSNIPYKIGIIHLYTGCPSYFAEDCHHTSETLDYISRFMKFLEEGINDKEI